MRGILYFLVSYLLFFTTVMEVRAEQREMVECGQCHQAVIERAEKSRYTHSVVLKDCRICHTAPKEVVQSTEISLESPSRDFIYHIKEVEDVPYTAMIQLKDDMGALSEPYRLEFFKKDLPNRSGDFKPVKDPPAPTVAGIKKKGFYSAKIVWEDSTPTSFSIECREKGGSDLKALSSTDLYEWLHEVEVRGLYQGKYLCTVTVQDLFGNEIRSAPFLVDTSTVSMNKAEVHDSVLTIKRALIFKISGRPGVFLEVHASRPSYCRISLKAKHETAEGSHFKIDRYTTIKACVGCHQFSVSHPVGVRAKSEDVHVPDDMSTIEDGVITCATCHAPHGADRPFLGKFEFRKDLCLKCHSKQIYFK